MVSKTYVDSLIDSQNICHPPKVINIDKEIGKFEYTIYLFKEYRSQELIIIPKIEIYKQNII